MTIKPSNYACIHPFRAFCQKVLPLIYDDSLSYYELLCKLLERVNLLTDNFNVAVDDIQKLYDYVNNYFDNLDVQDEINNKLDQMASDGTLSALLSKLNEKNIQPMSIGTLNKIIECYRTYENIDFVYGHNTAIRDYENPAEQPYEIDCSSLVLLCLMGCPFDESRYNNVNPVNNKGYLGYCFSPYKTKEDETNGIYSTTYQFAKWCAENGYGFYPNEGATNIKPGDVLFFNTEEDAEDRFLGIDHCELNIGIYNQGSNYTGKYPDLLTINASSGRDKIVQCNRRVSDGSGNSLLDKLVYCARIPIDNVEADPQIISSIFNVRNTGTINLNASRYEPISLYVKANFSEENKHVTVYLNNTPVLTSRNINITEVGKDIEFHFNLSGEYIQSDITSIRIECYNDNNAKLKEVYICKGVLSNLKVIENFIPYNFEDLKNKFFELAPNVYVNTHKFIIGSLKNYADVNNNFKTSGLFEFLYNAQSNYGFIKFLPYDKPKNNVYWLINDYEIQQPIYYNYPLYSRPTSQISPVDIAQGWLELLPEVGVYEGIIDLTLLTERPDNFYLRPYKTTITYNPNLKTGFVEFESYEDAKPIKYKITDNILSQ